MLWNTKNGTLKLDGTELDMTLGGDPSRQIAVAIPGAFLRMYQQWGHGLYEEAPDFNRTVLDFLK